MRTVSVFKNNNANKGIEIIGLTDEENNFVNNSAIQLSLQIHKKHSLIFYKKLDITSVLQIDLYFLFRKVLKIEILAKKINKYNHNTNVFLEDLKEIQLLQYFLKHNSIKVKYQRNDFFDIKQAVKQHYLEGISKISMYQLKSLFKKKSLPFVNSTSKKVLSFYEVNNNSMTNILKNITCEIDNAETFYSNEGIKNKLAQDKEQVTNMYSLLKFKDIYSFFNNKELTSYNQFKVSFKKALEDLFDNKYIRDVLLKDCFKIYNFMYYSLTIEARCFERLLDTGAYHSVIMSSDSHKSSRLLALIAKDLKVKTFVIQHGTVGELAFTPIYAYRFCAWGEIPKQQLIEFGEDPSKITITGNPVISNPIPERVIKSKDLNILVATNPIGKGNLIEFLDLIMQALQQSNFEYELKIRLHPGEDNKELIQGVMDNSRVIYSFDDNQMLKDSIEWSDLVVVSNSTVGIEALFHNRKLIVVDLGVKVPMFIPYEQYKAAPMPSTVYEILNEMKSIRDGIDEYDGRDLVKKYLGSSMGQESIRDIVQLVEGLENETY
ncbi:hypothetical protein [Bacillus mycoides]|uniref:hypothetical protein n=1 Tax=Bacillus mycoides TaxID=1405 RepID=UPI001C01BE4E|nr:hypothetical protein [Bacillus mycoides]QWG36136.1 hypothetical protein EXW30_25695 [Bacillus mycoides]